MPGASSRKRYRPSPSVVNVWVMSTPWSATVTPGSDSPVASKTRPEMVPEGVWAVAVLATRTSATMLVQTAFLNTINVSFKTVTDTRTLSVS